MSERMIEIQRAKLGLPPMAARAQQAAPSPSQAASPQTVAAAAAAAPLAASPINASGGTAPAVAQSQQQQQLAPRQQQGASAAAALHAEEQQLQVFLERLQTQRQDRHAETVPSALSRRMLQRQGVGYLDERVASVVSATGDRFLATLLQQAVACRDQRLTGAELKREGMRQRRQHMQQYKADADDRKRRKLEREEGRRQKNLAAIAAANALKGSGGNAAGSAASKSKKKKKKDTVNGGKTAEDEGLSEDSLDEEEEYYESYYGDGPDDGGNSDDEEEEDESSFMLLLRDLERPLEAWNIHLTGKAGLGTMPSETLDETENDEEQEVTEENGAFSQEDGDADERASSPAAKGQQESPSEKEKKDPSGSRPGTPAAPKARSTTPKPPT